MLGKSGIQMIYCPVTKIGQMARSVKDGPGLRCPLSSAFCIHCSCRLCYIGQTGQTVVDRYKEHNWCARLLDPSLPLRNTACSWDMKIFIPSAMVLLNSSSFWECLIMETIEIKLVPKVLNREGGLQQTFAWLPALRSVRSCQHP